MKFSLMYNCKYVCYVYLLFRYLSLYPTTPNPRTYSLLPYPTRLMVMKFSDGIPPPTLRYLFDTP